MNIKMYFRMIQKGWWIIVLTVLATLNVILIIDMFSSPIYEATTRMIVLPNAESFAGKDFVSSLSSLDNSSIVTTYADVFDSEFNQQAFINTLNLTEDEIAEYSQSTVVLPDSNVLEIYVTGPNAEITAKWANGVARTGIDYMRNLYQVYEVNILDAAVVPTEPISPKPARDLSLGGVLGLLVGVILAILRDQLRIPLEAYRQRRLVDSQSGAFNREHFETLLAEQTEKSAGEGGVFSLVMIKLEGLTEFYDTLPQQVLNRLLTDVVGVLKAGLRGNDSVGRWDESTFSLLLPDTPVKAAETIKGRLLKALTPPMALASLDEKIALRPAVGVAEFTKGADSDEIALKALKAMSERI
ncbi:MAG: diguanylate cyclase [Anaerolineae bacterium]|nr:diguanylate cyclase [Anaerolineae bacterium]